jgi:transcriptional regulator with XRE-family HTH domain
MTGKELRAIRERLGLGQYAFADRLKISRVSVTRMENGDQVITPSNALLVELLAREIERERAGQRAADTPGDESERVGQGRSGGAARGKQSHTSQSAKRRSTKKT